MQDQYINHIMNATGATVMLKGRGSGSFEPQGEGTMCLDVLFTYFQLIVFIVNKFD